MKHQGIPMLDQFHDICHLT